MADDLRPHPFDPPLYADAYGLVKTTPALTTHLLRQGYARGLFPWTDNPIGWFCPAERAIVSPKRMHLPRNFGRLMRRSDFVVRCDTAFEQVMRTCQRVHRDTGEWITERFISAYCDLFNEGGAHSVELYSNEQLVGGLYGVHIGGLFAAESMFARQDNAGKAALWFICAFAERLGVQLIDVQVLGRATAQMGAIVVPRAQYLALVQKLVPRSVVDERKESWRRHANFAVASCFPVRA